MVDTRNVIARPPIPLPPIRGAASVVLSLGVAALIASVAYVGHGAALAAPRASVATTSPSSSALPPASAPPVAVPPRTVTFRVDGTAARAHVDYSLDAGVDGGTEVALPWTGRLASAQDGAHSSSVFAYPVPGATGSLTCTILDQDGHVLAQHTVGDPTATAGADCVN